LQNFIADGTPLIAKTSYIVADGQPEFFNDSANFNGVQVQPPDAFPGAEGPLWDTLTKDVSAQVTFGDTTAQAQVISAPNPSGFSDCLTWVAQVFSVTTQPPLTTRGIKIF